MQKRQGLYFASCGEPQLCLNEDQGGFSYHVPQEFKQKSIKCILLGSIFSIVNMQQEILDIVSQPVKKDRGVYTLKAYVYIVIFT